MPRTKYETIFLSWSGANPQVIQPWALHPDGFDCRTMSDEDIPDGCQYCQDELEDVVGSIEGDYKFNKDRIVIDTFLNNDPWDDDHWAVEVESKPV